MFGKNVKIVLKKTRKKKVNVLLYLGKINNYREKEVWSSNNNYMIIKLLMLIVDLIIIFIFKKSGD